MAERRIFEYIQQHGSAITAVKELKRQGLTLQKILGEYARGDIERGALEEMFDADTFGQQELNGFIVVFEPENYINKDGKKIRLYLLAGKGLDVDLTLSEKKLYNVEDVQRLLDLDLTEITIEEGKKRIKIQKQIISEEHTPKPIDIDKEMIVTRRTSVVEQLLYMYLRKNVCDIGHIIYGVEDIPKERRALVGEDEILKRFPNADPLVAAGLTKIHTLDSWIHELAQQRIQRLKQEVRDFYRSSYGKTFVRSFLEQDFPVVYESVPKILEWIIENKRTLPSKREPWFLLRAVVAGTHTTERRIKSVYEYWVKIVKSVEETAHNNWAKERHLLEEPQKINAIFIPMIKEYSSRRGIYEPQTITKTLYAMYGMETLVDSAGIPLQFVTLNRNYNHPGVFLLENHETLLRVVDEILENQEQWVGSSQVRTTTSAFVARVIQNEERYRSQFLTQTKIKREDDGKELMSEDSTLRRAIVYFFRMNVDRYGQYMTRSHDKLYLLRNRE